MLTVTRALEPIHLITWNLLTAGQESWALGMAASHKERFLLLLSWPLVPFPAALTLCQTNTKPGAGASARNGWSSQKPSHQNAPLQVIGGLMHHGGHQEALHRLGLMAQGQLMRHSTLASA